MERFYYKKSRLNQLKGFCYTVQEGSVRGAAQKVGVEPATITMQIRSLETDLAIQLFKRTANHRLEITEKGQLFYEMAIVQLQGVDGLFESFNAKLKEKNENTLRIAGYYTSLAYILPEYIKRFSKEEKFKKTEIILCNIGKQEALKRLINNQIDFAFFPSTDENDTPIEVEKQNIFRLSNAVFMHKDHPLSKKKILSKEDIEKYECFVLDKYPFYDPRGRMEFKTGNIKFENSNSHIVLGLIKQNIAMGMCGELYANEYDFNDYIISKNIDHLFPKMFYSLFTLKNKKQKGSMLFFIKELGRDTNLK